MERMFLYGTISHQGVAVNRGNLKMQGFSKVVTASAAKQPPSREGDCHGAKNAPRNDGQ